MAEWIHMRHPEIEGTARVTRAALEKVHSKKGWVEVDLIVALASEALGVEVKSLGGLDREELDQVALGLGLDPTQVKNKGELVDLITNAEAARAGQP